MKRSLPPHPDQSDLFGTRDAPTNPIEAAFWEFHDANPSVYRLFDRFTKQALRASPKLAVALIVERIRWETFIETSGDEFKLNNNFRAYYARLWMRNNPDHNGLFRTRELRAGAESDALKGKAA